MSNQKYENTMLNKNARYSSASPSSSHHQNDTVNDANDLISNNNYNSSSKKAKVIHIPPPLNTTTDMHTNQEPHTRIALHKIQTSIDTSSYTKALPSNTNNASSTVSSTPTTTTTTTTGLTPLASQLHMHDHPFSLSTSDTSRKQSPPPTHDDKSHQIPHQYHLRRKQHHSSTTSIPTTIPTIPTTTTTTTTTVPSSTTAKKEIQSATRHQPISWPYIPGYSLQIKDEETTAHANNNDNNDNNDDSNDKFIPAIPSSHYHHMTTTKDTINSSNTKKHTIPYTNASAPLSDTITMPSAPQQQRMINPGQVNHQNNSLKYDLHPRQQHHTTETRMNAAATKAAKHIQNTTMNTTTNTTTTNTTTTKSTPPLPPNNTTATHTRDRGESSHHTGSMKIHGQPPGIALHSIHQNLSSYEKSEILHYNLIWFAGRDGKKKIHGSIYSKEPNHGYDDHRGDYIIIQNDHIAYRYEIVGILGKGSFGHVVRCVDHATNSIVALKIIRNKQRFQNQARIEAHILSAVCRHDEDGSANIVQMLDSFLFRNHICITFELLSVNLYEHIKSRDFNGCSPAMVRSIARQVLCTLRFLRPLNIVHCDIKPENILLTSMGASTIKVIDFGSACYSNQRIFTYIQSRFYRAPEVILGLPYGAAIDMWSLACVLAELSTGMPIFPGENEREQLECIMEVIDVPPPLMITSSPRLETFFDGETLAPLPPRPNSRGVVHIPGSRSLMDVMMLSGNGRWMNTNYIQSYGHGNNSNNSDNNDDEYWMFLDFLDRCLQWDPSKRMTPEEGLCHEWLRSAHYIT